MAPCRLAPLCAGIDDPFKRLVIDTSFSQQVRGSGRIGKWRTETWGRGYPVAGVRAGQRPIILPGHEGFRAHEKAAHRHVDLSGADGVSDAPVSEMIMLVVDR
jgi:hypothetical protein